jgi:hypothetical protein
MDGVPLTCTSDNYTSFYNATGLSEGVTYTIGIQTIDMSGNTNSVLVNDSAVALKLPQVYNLSGSDIGKNPLLWSGKLQCTSGVQISRDNISLGNISGSTFM